MVTSQLRKPCHENQHLDVIESRYQPDNPHHIKTPFAPCQQSGIEVKRIEVEKADIDNAGECEEIELHRTDLYIPLVRCPKEKRHQQYCAPNENVKSNRNVFRRCQPLPFSSAHLKINI